MQAGADDGLESVRADIFARLARGVADRRSPLHTPTLASVGEDGAARARTVVLRGWDPAGRVLAVHTDARAAKVAELRQDPRATLHFYDPSARLQVRACCRAALHAGDDVARAAWQAAGAGPRQIYRVMPAPGTTLVDPGDARPEGLDEDAAFTHFVVLRLAVRRLDWLFLASGGHRRARFDWDETGAAAATWLAP